MFKSLGKRMEFHPHGKKFLQFTRVFVQIYFLCYLKKKNLKQKIKNLSSKNITGFAAGSKI